MLVCKVLPMWVNQSVTYVGELDQGSNQGVPPCLLPFLLEESGARVNVDAHFDAGGQLHLLVEVFDGEA
jgi:hypothetical protein